MKDMNGMILLNELLISRAKIGETESEKKMKKSTFDEFDYENEFDKMKRLNRWSALLHHWEWERD